MPKVVDPEQRRLLIVEAVFRLIDRGGIQLASLRNVADEAGLNVGSVRHYFDSHDALLLAAADEMARRVTARMTARSKTLGRAYTSGDPAMLRRGIAALFAELLPLDAPRRMECAVWLAFTERSRTVPQLRAAADETTQQAWDATRQLLAAAGVTDPKAAASCLLAGIDGLTVAGLQFPERHPPQRLRRLLGHLVTQALAGRNQR